MESKNVGIWIRVSTDDQAKGESPEHHEKRARAYAEAKGWNVVEVYHLEGVSGKTVMHHPEAKRMMEAIKKGTITGLVFSKLARVARNTRELLDIADYFREHNADLISLQESIDTSSSAGRLFYTMIAAVAQWEREEIAQRVAASIPIRAKLGKRLGGHAPFGYKWEGKEFMVDEKEAPVRKLIYELFLKHKRKKTTATALNKMGYRTRKGLEFYDTTVERLIRDTCAKGERRANFTKGSANGTKRTWEYKPESEWVISPCPAIVTEEVWNECNRILDEQESKKQPVGPKAVHLLSGYVTCGLCTKKMYVFHHTDNPTYTCKACKNRISEKDIDEIYHSQLKTFLLTEKDISDFLKESDTTIKEKESLVEVLLNEAETARKKTNNLVEMRMNNELTREYFGEHYNPLRERLTQIENQLPELQGELDFLKIQYLSSDVVMKDAKDLYDRWSSLQFEDKRSIVETITDSITVGKEDISIALAYLPSASLNTGKSQHDL